MCQDLWAHVPSTRKTGDYPAGQSNNLSTQPLNLTSTNSNPRTNQFPIKIARFVLFLLGKIIFLYQPRNRYLFL